MDKKLTNVAMLQDHRKILQEDALVLERERHELEEETHRLKDKITDLNRKLGNNKRQQRAISEMIVILRSVPHNTRQEILSTMKHAERKDITVGDKRHLDQITLLLKRDLREMCPHSLILTYDGHEGSRSMDYDDARPEIRVCVICGLDERSYIDDIDELLFDKLADNANRVLKRDIRRDEEKRDAIRPHKNVWRPLEEWLDIFGTRLEKSMPCGR